MYSGCETDVPMLRQLPRENRVGIGQSSIIELIGGRDAIALSAAGAVRHLAVADGRQILVSGFRRDVSLMLGVKRGWASRTARE